MREPQPPLAAAGNLDDDPLDELLVQLRADARDTCAQQLTGRADVPSPTRN